MYFKGERRDKDSKIVVYEPSFVMQMVMEVCGGGKELMETDGSC